MERQTLYERIGGDAAIARLVGVFYRRVLADPELAPFFADTPMERLRCMQQEFFSAALDGPVRYTGRSLAEVHHGLDIRPRHMRRFLDHLVATMRAEGLDEDDVYEIASRLAIYADEITGTSTVDG